MSTTKMSTTKDSKHTQEPWDLFTLAGGTPSLPNARRIIACVNACRGINPEAVPELLAALELLVRDIGFLVEAGDLPMYAFDHPSMLKANAAIAKAKGEAAPGL
jgi:hypothetical protein